MEQFAETTQLVEQIKTHVKKHGWPNTAKALREVIFIHVGWDSDFTVLNNVLRKIEKPSEIMDRYRKIMQDQRQEDIPDSPLKPPASHFS